MNILYHHRTASRDGQEGHITELVAALRARGESVRMVSPSDSGADAKDAADHEGRAAETMGRMGGKRGGLAQLRALVPNALMPLASRAYDAIFTRRLVRAGRLDRSDFVYERHALFNRVGLHAARRLGIPLMLEVNAPLAREEAALGRTDLARALRAEMDVIRAADAVLAVTGVLRDVLIEDGAAPDRVHVIPNGIDPARFLDPPRADTRRQWGLDGKSVLGFVGFPRPWHGLERVMDAMGRHRDGDLKNAVLLLGGEGPALNDLLARGETLGVADRIIVHGVVQRADIPAFIDAFDVALQPKATRYASPLKLFEYLARAVPVLAPRQPNIEEVLVDGVSGVLYEPDDEGDFDRALTSLARDAELRSRVGEGGRERVRQAGYTWPDNARRVVEIARRLT